MDDSLVCADCSSLGLDRWVGSGVSPASGVCGSCKGTWPARGRQASDDGGVGKLFIRFPGGSYVTEDIPPRVLGSVRAIIDRAVNEDLTAESASYVAENGLATVTKIGGDEARCVHGTNPPDACEHCERQKGFG